jgi:hypothetical protein
MASFFSKLLAGAAQSLDERFVGIACRVRSASSP